MMPNSREAPRFIAVAYGNVCRMASCVHPLFVGMFRRADKLSVAMDARCYGVRGGRRTSLRDYRMTPASVAVSVVGLGVLAAIAALL